LEIRFHVLNGSIRDVRYTRYRRCCHSCGAFTHFQRLGAVGSPQPNRQDVVTSLVFNGDAAVLPELELRAQQVIDKLLGAFESDWGMLPPYLRFDFLVERLDNGTHSVWLNEVGELSSSLCGWNGMDEVLDAVFDDLLKRSNCAGTDCPCTQRRSNLDQACFSYRVSYPAEVSEDFLFCEACSETDNSSVECEACGAIFCDPCVRKGECRKLATCSKCSAELCGQCVLRSKQLAWTAIANKSQKLAAEGTDLCRADVSSRDVRA